MLNKVSGMLSDNYDIATVDNIGPMSYIIISIIII